MHLTLYKYHIHISDGSVLLWFYLTSFLGSAQHQLLVLPLLLLLLILWRLASNVLMHYRHLGEGGKGGAGAIGHFLSSRLLKTWKVAKKKTQTNPNITLYNIYNIINIIYILFFIKTPRCCWKVWSELTPDANVDLSIIWKLVEVRPGYYQNRQQTNFMII